MSSGLNVGASAFTPRAVPKAAAAPVPAGAWGKSILTDSPGVGTSQAATGEVAGSQGAMHSMQEQQVYGNYVSPYGHHQGRQGQHTVFYSQGSQMQDSYYQQQGGGELGGNLHLPNASQSMSQWATPGKSSRSSVVDTVHSKLQLAQEAVKGDTFLCSIDVECVATGYGNRDRAVARVAAVDAKGKVLFDSLVKPDEPIVSHLTALTGIEPGSLDDAPSFEEMRAELLKILPKNAVLVGQAIDGDIKWLKLEQGKHFKASFDISQLFRIEFSNGKARTFSLRHEVLHLEGFEGAGTDIQAGAHDPVTDAVFSIRLFLQFSGATYGQLRSSQHTLLRVPQTPPFWKTTPLIDNVQLGPPQFYKQQ
mmetsp:Transcript_18692/g.34632  ORF Transcript_18692/g.34632 Transcript_18692/m.34632 type:complete len:364 (+) Transcript_18692:117-1208(+)|eukprot:CAMPEP_0184528700 /NCGR_PEP_ID=MMETSP0198_2-20121128/11935_1 /TAXON_ID=1112570 /ORGANISM="Thraustochytrium sp., Strain LLF1b" /LENGTH=363 /DNA_ID=CAMNT_0026920571 /DNA_START=29 /DNA_END=1120 /DNA_ORIENTATION=-